MTNHATNAAERILKPIHCSNEPMVDWLMEEPRRDPALVFSAGARRELADFICIALRREKDAATAELRAENEALKEKVEQWKNSCRELMRQREH